MVSAPDAAEREGTMLDWRTLLNFGMDRASFIKGIDLLATGGLHPHYVSLKQWRREENND